MDIKQEDLYDLIGENREMRAKLRKIKGLIPEIQKLINSKESNSEVTLALTGLNSVLKEILFKDKVKKFDNDFENNFSSAITIKKVREHFWEENAKLSVDEINKRFPPEMAGVLIVQKNM